MYAHGRIVGRAQSQEESDWQLALTHSILTAKTGFFSSFLQIFRFVFQFLHDIFQPKHDSQVKFTSCFTY